MAITHKRALRWYAANHPHPLVRKLAAELIDARERELDALAERNRLRSQFEELSTARPDPERLVLVVERDGWVELYGKSWHTIHVLHVPEGESLEDSKVPHVFREVLDDGILRATANCRTCPTQEGLERARGVKEFLSELERYVTDTQGNQGHDGDTTGVRHCGTAVLDLPSSGGDGLPRDCEGNPSG